jgi:NAD(P)H-nitrite reductase large subunit
MQKRYFIIGAGVAGITAAEQLRRGDADASITVINGEDYPFYRRLSLSTYLQGQTTLEALTVKQPKDYADLNITVLQDRVAQVKPSENTLVMTSGETHTYDGLIIATGGSAIRPPIPGINLNGVRLGYWDMKDTLWYEEIAKANDGNNAVVIGGGVLGLELADCFNQAGVKVTIVQLGATLGEPLTDAVSGEILLNRVKESGAECRIGVMAKEILGDENGNVRAVVTSAGEEIPAQAVGICIGIRPNVAFLQDSGIELVNGCIGVDGYLKTNFDNIFAAGDCTWVSSGNMVGYRPNRTWQVATNQGTIAAMNLQGMQHPYDEGLFYNAGVLYDLPYTMLGNFNPDPNDESCKVYTYDTKGDQFAHFKLTVSEGRLVGAMLLGRQRRTNILRKIMEGNFIVTGHEHELMDTKFKPKDLPVADIQAAGDADVEAKLAAYASKG